MIKLGKKRKKHWFIARKENNSVIHYGFVDNKTEMESGQDVLEEFEKEKNWKDRLIELGIKIEK